MGTLFGDDFVDHRRAQIGRPYAEVGAKPFVAGDLQSLVQRSDGTNDWEYVLEPAELFGIEDGHHDCREFGIAHTAELRVVVGVCQILDVLLVLLDGRRDARADVPARCTEVWGSPCTDCGSQCTGGNVHVHGCHKDERYQYAK